MILRASSFEGASPARSLALNCGAPITPPAADAHRKMWRKREPNCAFRRRAAEPGDAFVPPKPNELDSATLISRFFASCGTRSIAVSTEGLSRLSVGGTILSRIASAEKIASIAPAAPSKMTGRRFCRRHREPARAVAEQTFDRLELDLIAHRRRRAVGVDVVDLARRRRRRASVPPSCSGKPRRRPRLVP